MAPVQMRVDDERALPFPDDLGVSLDAVLARALEHLEHVVAVAAELARPAADPNDVGREQVRMRLEAAALERLANGHHRRSSL